MSSLPFSIPLFAHLAKADGLVRLEGSSLILEFQIQDRALGLFRSDLKELRFPVSDIEHIQLKTGWFRRPRLRIQTDTMRVSRQIPGSEHGTFELTFDNRHLLVAKQLVSQVEQARAKNRSSRVESHGLE